MPTQLISIGPPTTLIQNVVYALPAQLVQVNTSSACQTSVDQSTWVAYTSDTPTSASFLRSAGVNTVVTVKSATKGGSSGGSSSLPTAPIGQVLISQGVGVAPIFSANPVVTRIDAGAGILISSELDLGGVPTIRRDVANGTLIMSFSDYMIAIPERTLAGLFSPSYVGTLANISDSTVNTIGATVVGGGSFHVLARFNGTIWKVAAV